MAKPETLTEAGERLTRSAGLRIDDWEAWWNAVTQPAALVAMVAIVVSGVLAWVLSRAAARRWHKLPPNKSIVFGNHGYDGALFPALWLVLAVVGQQILLAMALPIPLFRVALPALVALLVIRLGARVLRAAFPDAQGVGMVERGDGLHAVQATVLGVPGGGVDGLGSTDGSAGFGPTSIALDNTCECCRLGVAFAGPGKPAVVFRNIYAVEH